MPVVLPIFGGFDVLGPVAQGSTGTVWKARQRELDRVVAIKELAPALLAAKGFVDRFRGEAQTLAGIDDPHVVAVYDYVESTDRAYLVTEWVDGVALTAVLAEHGSLSAEQSLGVLRGALMGLAHAHDRGVVHRDVSPGNILVDRQGVSKLADFGLAAPTGADGGGAAVGTPAFASPEAARGAPMSPASDVYSAAAVLFLLLTGRPPFPGDTVAAVLDGHVNGPLPKLSGHGQKLADLLGRAMAKAPDARPPDAAAFLAELEDAARDRYGADWLKRASIAGLVGSAATTVAAGATAAGAGAAGTSPAAATQIIDAGAAATGRITARPGRARRPRLPRGGIAAAVVAATVVVALLGGTGIVMASRAGNAGTKSTAAGKPPASPSPSVSPTPSLPAVPAFAGTYSVTQTITGVTGKTVDPVGKIEHYTWKVTPVCASGRCSAAIASSSGARYTLTYAGDKWSVVRPTTGACYDAAGQRVPRRASIVATLSLIAAGPDDPSRPVTRLTGTSEGKSAKGCFGTPYSYTYSLVVARTGA